MNQNKKKGKTWKCSFKEEEEEEDKKYLESYKLLNNAGSECL